MAILVTDPVIRVRTADDTRAVGLHEVLAHADDGSLIDLPGMRADQRAAVVTALAIISHLLRRYSKSAIITPHDWLKELRAQLGEDALVLAGGPDEKPQFLQPVPLLVPEFTRFGTAGHLSPRSGSRGKISHLAENLCGPRAALGCIQSVECLRVHLVISPLLTGRGW
jgi:hypothetical protein